MGGVSHHCSLPTLRAGGVSTPCLDVPSLAEEYGWKQAHQIRNRLHSVRLEHFATPGGNDSAPVSQSSIESPVTVGRERPFRPRSPTLLAGPSQQHLCATQPATVDSFRSRLIGLSGFFIFLFFFFRLEIFFGARVVCISLLLPCCGRWSKPGVLDLAGVMF